MTTNYLIEKTAKSNCLSVICAIMGHNYIVTKKINDHFKEYECSRCKVQVTNDSLGKKISLTDELKEINETLFYLYLRREFRSRFYFQNKNNSNQIPYLKSA